MLLLFNTVTTEPLVLYLKLYSMCKGFIQNPPTVSASFFINGVKGIKTWLSQYFDNANLFDKRFYVKP